MAPSSNSPRSGSGQDDRGRRRSTWYMLRRFEYLGAPWGHTIRSVTSDFGEHLCPSVPAEAQLATSLPVCPPARQGGGRGSWFKLRHCLMIHSPSLRSTAHHGDRPKASGLTLPADSFRAAPLGSSIEKERTGGSKVASLREYQSPTTIRGSSPSPRYLTSMLGFV